MRDVFGGALLGAVLAVSVNLASLHSQTHHDAHHATSALHQALRRVVPARSQWLPFFAGCAPSQTCVRNLMERPRSRLAGAPRGRAGRFFYTTTRCLGFGLRRGRTRSRRGEFPVRAGRGGRDQ